MRKSNQIVIATTNRAKFEEFVSLFQSYPGIHCLRADEAIRNASKLGNVETFQTYEENSIAKARAANQACHFPCLADDTGLEVEILDNRPGVKSHRYAAPSPGVTQDRANLEKLLQELKGVPMAKRNAVFHCCCTLVMEGVLIHTMGTLEGTIAEAPSGHQGFGYDSVFIPKGFKKTLAEMSSDEKNKISHRAKALESLMTEVKRRGIVFAKP